MCLSSKAILERCPRKASGKKNVKEGASHFWSSERQEVTQPDPERKTEIGAKNRAGPPTFPASSAGQQSQSRERQRQREKAGVTGPARHTPGAQSPSGKC